MPPSTSTRSPAPWRAFALTVCAVLLVGCGGDAPGTHSEAGPVSPPAGAFVSPKPSPQLGTLEARVTARPSDDRVVLEATWSLRPDTQACEAHLILPDAATLLEGPAVTSLEATGQGEGRWLISFAGDAPLDAVVRLCGTEDGAFRSREVAIRLTP